MVAFAVGMLAMTQPGCDPDSGLLILPFNCRVPGLAGGLWVDGQDPREGMPYPPEQARERLRVVAESTSAIRLYSALFDSDAACIARREFGLHVMLGIWIGPDDEANTLEFDAAIEAAQQGCVDDLIVGNEVLLRGDQPSAVLIELIEQARAEVPPGVRVGTAEVWDRLVAHQSLIDVSDIVVAHAHSYWAGVGVDDAVAYARLAYARLSAVAAGRPVILGEVGLPTAGSPRGEAVPSVENANRHLVEVTTWAQQNDVEIYFFSMFDEAWKDGEPGGVGPHWGVHDALGQLKPGLEAVFECERRALELPPLPDPDCRVAPPFGETLNVNPGFDDRCDGWAPSWFPPQSGSLCLLGHGRPDDGDEVGCYMYTDSGNEAANQTSSRSQNVAFAGGAGAIASVFVKARNLVRGRAFLRVRFEDDAGTPLAGDEVTLTGPDYDAAGEHWHQLALRFERVPCGVTHASLSFGIDKTQVGAPAVIATFDDASLVAVEPPL